MPVPEKKAERLHRACNGVARDSVRWIAFRAAFVPLDSMLVLARVRSIFATAVPLLILVRRGEGMPGSSIGVRRFSADSVAASIVIGLLACTAAPVRGIF